MHLRLSGPFAVDNASFVRPIPHIGKVRGDRLLHLLARLVIGPVRRPELATFCLVPTRYPLRVPADRD